MILVWVVLSLHDVVCNHVHLGGTFWCSAEAGWIFTGLGADHRSRVALAGVCFIAEQNALCVLGAQRDGPLKLLLGLKDQRRTKRKSVSGATSSRGCALLI